MATVARERPAEPHPGAPLNFSTKIDYRQIRDSVAQLLKQGFGKYQLILNSKLIDEVQSEFEAWAETEHSKITSQLKNIPAHAQTKWLQERFEINDRRRPENRPLRLLIDFLFQFVQLKIKQLDSLKSGNLKFRNAFTKVRGLAEREKLILNYASELGASPSQVKNDAKALARWFDEEAVVDRYGKRVGQIELLVTFVFDRLTEVISHVFKLAYQYHSESAAEGMAANRESLHARLAGIWQRLNIEARIHDALIYDGDDRVHVAVLKCLSVVIGQLPDELGAELLDRRTLVFIHRAAMENNSEVWIQCQALSILDSLSFAQALPFLKHRLTNPNAGDDIFVRRHALKLIEQQLLNRLERGTGRDLEVIPHESEPSPFVRQKMAKVAFLSTQPEAHLQWRTLTLNDPIEQVRAASLLAGIEITADLPKTYEYLAVVEECLQNESNSFVLRTAFHCLTQLLQERTNGVASSSSSSVDSTFLNGQHGRSARHMLRSKNSPTEKNENLDSNETATREAIHVFYRQRIVPLIAHLQSTHAETPLRRWAAQTNEQIWACLDDRANALVKKLRPRLQQTPPGRSCYLSKQDVRGISREKLGRIFAVLAQDDFGYDIHKGWFRYRILRGPSFGFRLWRLIHEFRNTATDKRQALRHTVGRISNATLRAPSQILGELSETKVPGEPLTIGEDGSWRPFLPLPDDLVSVLNLSWFFPRTVEFYTSQGVTSVTGPRRFLNRLKAAWKLNFRFADIARIRNWNEESFAANTYIKTIQNLGFKIEFSNHEHKSENVVGKSEAEPTICGDETVSRFFFPAVVGIPMLVATFESAIWKTLQRFSDYFGSAFENSLEQLIIFAAAILLFTLARHFYANYTLRKARRNIPLSIGGWGTRGKSGTERLKAALIGVMGHGLVSKTTGCEAMFIHASPFGEPLEIPLFRPYDKATIWEQRDLIRTASRLNPSVFLWECMALTPSYVDVLQRQWTCDDLGTITNTYPDHEDVQGPAGYDVARTISGFVPLNSHLLATEQMMRPFITESCRSANTSFRGVGWLESGLITDDILERFPYKEHPDNIALVSAMGDELGCEYEFSLKAMADYLVPDLGVLKTYPVSSVRTRKIEFTNGMSANERFGCMGNWRRLGFDNQDPWEEPATWICGVVNNRADRVPRSKVFAKIIVEDINADRFFLIGSNLKGLSGFIEEAWAEKAKTISLRDEARNWSIEFALKKLKQAARDFRQPIEPSHVRAKLNHCVASMIETTDGKTALDTDELAGLWQHPESIKTQLESIGVADELTESIIRHRSDWINALNEYEDMKSLIVESPVTDADVVEQRFIKLLKTWYDRKIVLIENFDASGEEVVASIVDETPPGFLNRAMGLQNIKGTGLDFVYRFQAWDMCYEACRSVLSNQVQMAEKGFLSLISMPVIGQLCQNQIRKVIKHARSNNLYRRPELETLLEQLEKKLQDATGEENEPTRGAKGKSIGIPRSKFTRWIVDITEQFIDVHDSIRRRKRADFIYHDLANERISRQRAVVELRKINKRQKGGWLASELEK